MNSPSCCEGRDELEFRCGCKLPTSSVYLEETFGRDTRVRPHRDRKIFLDCTKQAGFGEIRRCRLRVLLGEGALGHDVLAELDHVIVVVVESSHSVRSRL